MSEGKKVLEQVRLPAAASALYMGFIWALGVEISFQTSPFGKGGVVSLTHPSKLLYQHWDPTIYPDINEVH